MIPEGVGAGRETARVRTLKRKAKPFAERERAMLLMTPGLGDLVVRRLEQAGFNSLESMRHVGLDEIVERVCAQAGSTAIANRRRAIERALQLRVP